MKTTHIIEKLLHLKNCFAKDTDKQKIAIQKKPWIFSGYSVLFSVALSCGVFYFESKMSVFTPILLLGFGFSVAIGCLKETIEERKLQKLELSYLNNVNDLLQDDLSKFSLIYEIEQYKDKDKSENNSHIDGLINELNNTFSENTRLNQENLNFICEHITTIVNRAEKKSMVEDYYLKYNQFFKHKELVFEQLKEHEIGL